MVGENSGKPEVIPHVVARLYGQTKAVVRELAMAPTEGAAAD